jgi:hypothetical protein
MICKSFHPYNQAQLLNPCVLPKKKRKEKGKTEQEERDAHHDH